MQCVLQVKVDRPMGERASLASCIRSAVTMDVTKLEALEAAGEFGEAPEMHDDIVVGANVRFPVADSPGDSLYLWGASAVGIVHSPELYDTLMSAFVLPAWKQLQRPAVGTVESGQKKGGDGSTQPPTMTAGASTAVGLLRRSTHYSFLVPAERHYHYMTTYHRTLPQARTRT